MQEENGHCLLDMHRVSLTQETGHCLGQERRQELNSVLTQQCRRPHNHTVWFMLLLRGRHQTPTQAGFQGQTLSADTPKGGPGLGHITKSGLRSAGGKNHSHSAWVSSKHGYFLAG